MTMGDIKVILKSMYFNLTLQDFPYDIDITFEYMQQNARLELEGKQISKSLFKIKKVAGITFNGTVFENDEFSHKMKMIIIAHELCHIVRLSETNFIVDINDSHDIGWERLMKRLGIEDPQPKTSTELV